MTKSKILFELTKELPRDPGEALVSFAERVSEKLGTPVAPAKLSGEDKVLIYRYYYNFAHKFRIDVGIDEVDKVEWLDIHRITDKIIENRAKYIKRTADAEIDDIINDFSAQLDDEFGVAKLNGHEKQKIHDHISRIRTLIEASDLSDRKKNALFDRLNALSSEVDAYGTRTDRFFAFMGDVAFVVGDMTKKAKPLIDEVKEMMKIVSRSRARQEGISLPPGDEPVLLPAPDETNKEVE